MKLVPLLIGSILLFSVISIHAYCQEEDDDDDDDVSLEVEPPTADIEDRVAELMDEIEVLRGEKKAISADKDASEEVGAPDAASSIGDNQEGLNNNGPEDGSKAELQPEEQKKSGVELIEEARDNKFTIVSLLFGQYYESIYKKINKYLVERLRDNDNINDNMQVAVEWLKMLESSSFRSEQLLQALKQLTALTKIGGENKCTKNSYGILRKNDLATQGKAHKRRSKLDAMRRIDKIVYQYSIQHALDCIHEYPVKFANKRAELDQAQLSYVESLFDQLFQTVLRPSSYLGIFAHPDRNKKISPIEIVRDIKSLDKSEVAEVIFDKLRFFSRNDPNNKYLGYVNDDKNGKFTILEDRLKELYEQYIVKPCEYYIDQLGFDILIPARFDLMMLEPEDRYLLNDDQTMNFYVGYARFRACNLLVFQDRKSLARRLVKAAWKQPKDQFIQ